MAIVTEEEFKARIVFWLAQVDPPTTGEKMALAVNRSWNDLKDDGRLMGVEIDQSEPNKVKITLAMPDRVFNIDTGV